MVQHRLRIGTRGSPLALAQAQQVRDLLADPQSGLGLGEIEIVTISTTGDEIQDRRLLEIGGKGLFTKEIEEALLDQRIDLAVHSSKDMPTAQPAGLTFDVFLEREDPRDAWISRDGASLSDLKAGSTVGTASLRRAAQILRLRPDLKVVPLRGNVDTRLRKLASGEVDATLLALAGLKRLGRQEVITEVLEVDQMLPSPAQGAIGLQTRTGDRIVDEIISPLNHASTRLAVRAERACLGVLDGDCRTPIAALATISGGKLSIKARVLSTDGRHCFDAELEGPAEEADQIGADVAAALIEQAGSDFMAALKAGSG